MVVDPVLRQRLEFTRGTDPDGGEVLHVEIWLDPRGGVTPHIHPAMEERFEVLSGTPSFLAGREWRTAAAGDTVVVPAGSRHAYRNRSTETVHMVCHARPPSTLQEFLEETAALSRAGKITRRGLPTGFRALRDGLALAARHRDMVVLLFPPMPPPVVQKLLFARHNRDNP
jgi:quercetin dioxygenase-like cupin family protein